MVTPGAGTSPCTVTSSAAGGGAGLSLGPGLAPIVGVLGAGSTFGAVNEITARILAAIGLPPRVAGSKRQPLDAATAADAKGSGAPSAGFADRTDPSAWTVMMSSTVASPLAPSG